MAWSALTSGNNTQGVVASATLFSHKGLIGETLKPGSFQQAALKYNHAAIIDNQGMIWTWGTNTYGQVGNNSVTTATSPVSIARTGSYTSVKTGYSFSLAIDASTGNIWAWGYNNYGQLGDSTATNRSSPVIIVRTASYSQISAGYDHSLAIDATTGNIWAWGFNNNGQLGDGTIVNSSSPIAVSKIASFSQISAGYQYSLAIDATTGNIWVWGYNNVGQFGDGTTDNKSSPISIARTSSYFKISAGYNHSLAIDSSTGNVWAWGSSGANPDNTNYLGKLGNVPTVYSYKSMTFGYYSFILLDSTGTIWTGGGNTYGQLGDGTVIGRSSPVLILRSASYSSVTAGAGTAMAIDGSTGNIWAWGYNSSGRLGDNTTQNRSSPVAIARTASYSVLAPLYNSNHCLAIDASTGNIWAWGYNNYGQLGINTTTSRSSPVTIVRTASYVAIAAGPDYSLAIDATTGNIWAWGRNSYGQLGDNTTTTKSSPVAIIRTDSYIAISAAGDSSGLGYGVSMALNSSGTVYCWGYNNYGQIGDNTITNRSSQVAIASNLSFSQISAGSYQCFAIDISTGNIWGWGSNFGAEIGDGTFTDRSSPVMLARQISFSAVKGAPVIPSAIEAETGFLWIWGQNLYSYASQLQYLVSGNFTDIGWYYTSYRFPQFISKNITLDNQSSPVAITRTASYSNISAGYQHSLAVDATTGSVWSWGQNIVGESAIGYNTSSVLIPTAIQGSRSYQSLKIAYQFTWLLDSSGYLYETNILTTPPKIKNGTFSDMCLGTAPNWCSYVIDKNTGNILAQGTNTYGQLGNNAETDIYVLVPNARTASYSKVVCSMQSTAATTMSAMAVDASTGMIWSWGYNNRGQLGDGTITNSSSPIAIQRTASYISIAQGYAHSLAIDASDGSVWSWGYNNRGQLGDNTVTNRSSPVTIVRSGSYKTVAAGFQSSFAIDASTGVVWAWGLNTSGQLGDNTITNKSSPVSIARVGSYSEVVSGYNTSGVIDASTGMVYMFGNNTNANLGNGTNVNSSSPIAISRIGSYRNLTISNDAQSNGVGIIDASTGYAFVWGLGLDVTAPGTLFANDFRSGLLWFNISPQQVVNTNSFVQIAAGSNASLFLPQNYSVWANFTKDTIHTSTMSDVHFTSTFINNPVSWTWYFGDGTSVDANPAHAFTIFGSPLSISLVAQGSFGDPYTATDSVSIYSPTQISNKNTVYMCGWGNAWASDGYGNINLNYLAPLTATAIDIGYRQFTNLFIEKDTNFVWGFGNNNMGQLGDNSLINKTVPTLIKSESCNKVACGYNNSAIINTNYMLYMTGLNTYGQVGDGTTINRSTHVAIARTGSYSDVVPSLYHSLSLEKSMGNIWAWGYNNYGQLGDNTTQNRSSPVAIVKTSSFIKVTAGDYFSAALEDTGVVWTWGYNNSGQLGINNVSAASSPISIIRSSSYSDISAGDSHILALDGYTGMIWTWGLNTSGQLGDGTIQDRSSPIAIIRTASYIAIAAGVSTSYAVDSTGLVFGWGINSNNEIGNYSAINYSSPVIIAKVTF